jgi:hypothetical protein
MKRFEYNADHQFVIRGYDTVKPFASFLPGVAGVFGIPMWVYYVNRGQLISSFGLESKDHPMLDFSPANMAYRRTEIDGFRTFIKVNGKTYEPFASHQEASRQMKIEMNAVSIEETKENLSIEVRYFNVTGEPYPGLIRKVTLKNLAKTPLDIEFVDGLATLWPYGTNQFMIKNMSNLAVAWFDVFNQEHKMPFMKNRSTTEDTAEVEGVEAGHFYISMDQNNEKLDVIYDGNLVFGYETSLKEPKVFQSTSLKELLLKEQVTVNQLMAAFSAQSITLKDRYTFYTLYGEKDSLESLNILEKSLSYDYFKDIEQRAKQVEKEITKPMEIHTAYPLFDAYMKQSFLDNMLRGGYPLVFKGQEKDIIYHIFSRIHGDMEREYNNFYVEPAYFSHGNGSYRDVNQNRRNDVYFVPEAAPFNIRQFMDLIQLDGHNPLTIQGSKLIFDQAYLNDVLHLVSEGKDVVQNILTKPFTPGKLMTSIDHHSVSITVPQDDFLKVVLSQSVQEIQSVYGTGYWSDHWMYNMDLIEQYLNIFPDRLKALLTEGGYRFYQSHVSVFPRALKYVKTKHGEIRQLGPLYHDQDKIEKTNLSVNQTNFHKNERHQIIRVNFTTKLLHLALIKFTSLDPELIGVMMDSEKPGWNDSMNGLPAIFGSGVTETVTLKRLIEFLIHGLEEAQIRHVEIPNIIVELFNRTMVSIPLGFDALQNTREWFDAKTRFFMPSDSSQADASLLINGLSKMLQVIETGLNKAKEIGHGLLPTYLSYQALSYTENGKINPETKYPCVDVTKWSVRMLPHYLEAPATYLKQLKNKEEAKLIYNHVKSTEMYDAKLKMYITSCPLDDETLEIGRARAFTKGWLEREANFMHMSYKYLIGILKSGLYDEYMNDMRTSMPPFMNPEAYGRSLLENASFIASSNNPNPNNHGRGFVARLTGTTSEAITLLYLMMTGKKLFTFKENVLSFQIQPILPSDFFDAHHEVKFRLFNHIDITIKNPSMKNTYEGLKAVQYELINGQSKVIVDQDAVQGELAQNIRNKVYDKIVVHLG